MRNSCGATAYTIYLINAYPQVLKNVKCTGTHNSKEHPSLFSNPDFSYPHPDTKAVLPTCFFLKQVHAVYLHVHLLVFLLLLDLNKKAYVIKAIFTMIAFVSANH